MKILVLNCGSSSVKYKLFDIDSKTVLAQGGAEKIGLEDSFLKLTLRTWHRLLIPSAQGLSIYRGMHKRSQIYSK